MRYHDEWLKMEAEDELDEFYHRHPEGEYLFYRAVANGNVEAVSAYIRKRKIAIAENLLKFTDHSMIELANLLSFSSESHFIQQFREVVGMTPKKYRDENYPIQWDGGLK